MRFFIIDNRQFLPSDCRLVTVLQVLHETAILGRATSWTHFGMGIVGENMYTDVLSLQDMKHLSLFGFNKAFNDLGEIIRNHNAAFGVNLAEKKQKLLSNISFALQSAMKQFKEMKGNKKIELLITIIAARWRGNVEREVEEFFHSSRDAVSSQIHIIEIGDVEFLKNFAVTDKIQIHSLPTKCLCTSVQAACKAGTRPFELIITFPNNNISTIAKIEDLFLDFTFSQKDIPQNLTIVSYAYPVDLCQTRVHRRCFLLSCADKDIPNTYRWEALSKLIQNNGTILMAKEPNTFFNYALIPCDNLRILMQPIACADLLLPTNDTITSELIPKDFEAIAKNCGLAERYGFGPKSNIICHLKDKWSKEMAYNPVDSPNPKQGRQSVPIKKRTSKNLQQLQKIASLAHPALGMYSNK